MLPRKTRGFEKTYFLEAKRHGGPFSRFGEIVMGVFYNYVEIKYLIK